MEEDLSKLLRISNPSQRMDQDEMPGIHSRGSDRLFCRLDQLCEEMHDNDSLIVGALKRMTIVEELENEQTLENAQASSEFHADLAIHNTI